MTNNNLFSHHSARVRTGAPARSIRGGLALACLVLATFFTGCGDAVTSAPKHPVVDSSSEGESSLSDEALDAYECQLAPSVEDSSDKAVAFAPIKLTGCSEAK